jgi:hypothetical protein
MAEFVELVNQNPIIFLIIGVVILILLLVILFQGRPIKTLWGEIGAKPDSSEQTSTSPQSLTQFPSISQSQNITQNPVVNVYSGASLSLEQMGEIAELVAQRVKDIRKDVDNQSPSYLYKPTDIPERIRYIYSVRNDIESKIRAIVLDHFGHWMGASEASFDTFFGIAWTQNLISKQLTNDINYFYLFTQGFLNAGEIFDESFLEIQYLAAEINKDLDYLYRKVEED